MHILSHFYMQLILLSMVIFTKLCQCHTLVVPVSNLEKGVGATLILFV